MNERQKEKQIEIVKMYGTFTGTLMKVGFELQDIIYTVFGTTGEMIFRISGEKEFDRFVSEIKRQSTEGAPEVGSILR